MTVWQMPVKMRNYYAEKLTGVLQRESDNNSGVFKSLFGKFGRKK